MLGRIEEAQLKRLWQEQILKQDRRLTFDYHRASRLHVLLCYIEGSALYYCTDKTARIFDTAQPLHTDHCLEDCDNAWRRTNTTLDMQRRRCQEEIVPLLALTDLTQRFKIPHLRPTVSSDLGGWCMVDLPLRLVSRIEPTTIHANTTRMRLAVAMPQTPPYPQQRQRSGDRTASEP